MRTTLLACITFAVGLAAQDLPPLRYRVKDPTPGQRLLLQQHFDVLGQCCGRALTSGPIDLDVEQAQAGLLLAIAPRAEMVGIGRPFHEVEAERIAAGEDPDASYYTVAEIEAEIDAQVALHPTRAQKVNLSTLPGGVLTHEGRPIYALKVSDNVAASEDEPAIVFAAQHHARELNSPHMVIRAMQRVLADYATDPQIQATVDGYELWFVPMVNPDGVNHVWNVYDMWRKNRRNNGTSFGVDLNRNYPFLWGLCGASTSPSSDTYRGPSAGSEPETQVMRNLIATVRPEIYLDVHSSGRDVLRMWAPCANVNPTMEAFQQTYCDDLRTPMGYDTRDPSASGEAPEDHYSSGGTLSYLIEVDVGSFQPAFAVTVAEELLVWPGVRRAFTTWRAAVRGHVRSALGSAPLVSTITFTPSVLNHGEVTKSRSSDGRYGLWLPVGAWNVTFAAAGHVSRTFPVTVASLNNPLALDVMLEPTGPVATTTKVGSGSIGTAVTFTYTSPGDAGKDGLIGWSLGTAPGIHLGFNRYLPLNHDFLMDMALSGNPFLSPTWVTLNGSAQAQSVLLIPNETWLIGFTTYVAGITIDPAYQYTIKTWSAPLATTIIP
ncbi:MAG: M14 family zinc carboxypeptidase [Planctomycetota bacterium]